MSPSLRPRAAGLATALAALVAARAAEAAPPEQAAPPAPETAALDASPPPAEEVVVIGQRIGPSDSADVLTSVDILGGEELQKQSTAEPLELLRRAPAVYVESFNQGIITADLGLRGFNTQGDVAHTKLLIDGIPSNHHVGLPDMKAVFPLEIERMEVVKGTNDPRYGLNNVAGNVDVVTRKTGNERVARLRAGSFWTVEPQVLVATQDDTLSQTYFAGYHGSDGYRDHARSDKVAGSAKWFYEPSRELRVGLILRGMLLDADAPGYLSAEDARARPTASPAHSAADGGRQSTLHASVHLDHELAEGLSWQLKAYGQAFLRDRWVRFDPELSQQMRVEDDRQYGAISVLTYRTRDPRALGLAVEWGVDYQLQDSRYQRFPSVDRARQGAAFRDEDLALHAAGSYVQASARPIEPVKLVAALRADRLAGAGRFLEQPEGEAPRRVERDLNDYGFIWQPKASVMVTPVKGQSLYANYGRTFQIGTGRGAYATRGAPLDPSINDGWEVGYRSSVSPWLKGHLAYWEQRASGEVRDKGDGSGDAENVGETLRRGFDVELTLRPFELLSVWGAFSRALSEQVEPGPALAANKGKELDHVPSFSAKGGIDVRPLQELLVSVFCYAQGDYYLTKENTTEELGSRKVGDYVLVNASASYDATETISLGVEVNNLLDQSYDTSIWHKDYGAVGAQHNPGNARSAYVTGTLIF
ncbi:TonB-dependent receptor [Sorangium cellulosum]|uniref:TonB-dependent receptor n=1 Tax=Sorangium cellulosum TaxID=56 RepID=A0A4P2QCE4_SORCE|nr:TonB-dependent receptor [Sorangium cellulosum]AUX27410.1 TonB-dependent receptor [Sorangium cellulosum]